MPNQTIDDAPTYLTAGSARTLFEVSLAAALTEKLRWNTAATTAPTTGDDSGDGYSVGSLWFDRTADVIYVCIDATLTAAIWIRLPDYLAVVLKSLYDANTILKADSANTPVALTMGASTILARLAAGGIVAATPAEINALLATLTAASAPGTDNILVKTDGTGRAMQATGISVADSTNDVTGLGNINSQRIPDGTATAITGTTHSSTSADYNRCRPCSNASGCTVTVDAGQGGSWVAYKTTVAGQQVTLTSGTCTITVPEDFDQSGNAVSLCRYAVVGVLFDAGGTTGSAFGLMEAP